MEEQKAINDEEDWRAKVSDSSTPVLKVADGETKTFVFLNEGEKRTHSDYGTSIVFQVEFEKEKMSFYIRENNYSLLKQVKEIGKLTGTAVKVSRVGSKKSDTRYTIEKVK